MEIKHFAVLITCFNRRETTLGCLTSLYQQKLPKDIFFDVYLVDDGSTDGTEQAVRQQFPKTIIIIGNGNLFWCGGMRLAWTEAAKRNYDAYLWLNDDTILLSGAISVLLLTATNISQNEKCEGIIVGSCYDPLTGKQTYGGRFRKEKVLFVTPSDKPQECELINGNIVLIPRNISLVVGNISGEFIHLGGDNDYGLRAIKAGFKVWIAPGYQGKCAENPYCAWADPHVPLRERWRILQSPKGQPPHEVYIYARRHSGFLWPMDLVKLYFRVIFPGLHNKIKHLFFYK